jgi:hypothetical protein
MNERNYIHKISNLQYSMKEIKTEWIHIYWGLSSLKSNKNKGTITNLLVGNFLKLHTTKEINNLK